MKLRQIRAHIEAGPDNAARNQLCAFINPVYAFLSEGIPTAQEGDGLFAPAEALIEVLT